MRTRSARLDLTSERGLPLALDVRLWSTSTRAGGEFDLHEGAAGATHRAVVASTCREVAAALALAATLALDPDISEAGETGVTAASTPDVTVHSDARPADARHAADLHHNRSSKPAAHTSSATPPRYALGLGAEALVVTGVLPNTAVAGGMFVQLEALPTRTLTWAPMTRVSVEGSTASSHVPRPDTARFLWWSVPVHLCPVALRVGPVTARPCVFGELGVLRGEGVAADNVTEMARLWYAAGLTGLVQWSPSPRWFVGAEVSLRFPLVRDRFELRPERAVHTAETGIAGGLSLGWRVWP